MDFSPLHTDDLNEISKDYVFCNIIRDLQEFDICWMIGKAFGDVQLKEIAKYQPHFIYLVLVDVVDDVDDVDSTQSYTGETYKWNRALDLIYKMNSKKYYTFFRSLIFIAFLQHQMSKGKKKFMFKQKIVILVKNSLSNSYKHYLESLLTSSFCIMNPSYTNACTMFFEGGSAKQRYHKTNRLEKKLYDSVGNVYSTEVVPQTVMKYISDILDLKSTDDLDNIIRNENIKFGKGEFTVYPETEWEIKLNREILITTSHSKNYQHQHRVYTRVGGVEQKISVSQLTPIFKTINSKYGLIISFQSDGTLDLFLLYPSIHRVASLDINEVYMSSLYTSLNQRKIIYSSFSPNLKKYLEEWNNWSLVFIGCDISLRIKTNNGIFEKPLVGGDSQVIQNFINLFEKSEDRRNKLTGGNIQYYKTNSSKRKSLKVQPVVSVYPNYVIRHLQEIQSFIKKKLKNGLIPCVGIPPLFIFFCIFCGVLSSGVFCECLIDIILHQPTIRGKNRINYIYELSQILQSGKNKFQQNKRILHGEELEEPFVKIHVNRLSSSRNHTPAKMELPTSTSKRKNVYCIGCWRFVNGMRPKLHNKSCPGDFILQLNDKKFSKKLKTRLRNLGKYYLKNRKCFKKKSPTDMTKIFKKITSRDHLDEQMKILNKNPKIATVLNSRNKHENKLFFSNREVRRKYVNDFYMKFYGIPPPTPYDHVLQMDEAYEYYKNTIVPPPPPHQRK